MCRVYFVKRLEEEHKTEKYMFYSSFFFSLFVLVFFPQWTGSAGRPVFGEEVWHGFARMRGIYE